MTARANMFENIEDFANAEREALLVGEVFGPEHLPCYLLSKIYWQAGLHERALEFDKENLRRNLWSLDMSSHNADRAFAQLAVDAGVAGSLQEGLVLHGEFTTKVRAGEDTGKFPREYLRPVLSQREPLVPGSSGRFVIGVTAAAAAVAATAALAVFLLRRRKKRTAAPG